MALRFPFLIPFLGVATGLVFSDQTGIVMPISSLLLLVGAVALAALIRQWLPITIMSGIFFFGWGLTALAPWQPSQMSKSPLLAYAGNTPVLVEGVITGRPQSLSTGGRFALDVEHVKGSGGWQAVFGRMLVTVAEGEHQVHRGDRIRFVTRLSIPRPLGLPGEFDYRRYLAFQEIAVSGRVADSRDIVLIRGDVNDSVLRRFDLAAGRLGGFIRRTIPDPAVSSVLTALLIGDQRRIPADVTEAYSRAGVSHILSVSGFHVGIIAWFIFALSLQLLSCSEKLALRVNLRRAVPLLAVPAMVLYLLLTGSAPATARSVIMLVMFVLALGLEREVDPINTLLISAFLLVVIQPPTLFELSFQLSFLALWGIVVLVPLCTGYLERLSSRMLRWVLQFLAVSAAATIATAVPVLMAFNQASLNGLLTNFLIVPLLGYGAVLIGFCALPLYWVSEPAASALLSLAAIIVDWSNELILYCSRMPVLSYHGISRVDFLLAIAVLCVLTFVAETRKRVALSIGVVVLALTLHILNRPVHDGSLKIFMLSVGQAESLLVTLPDGSFMLVDGGGYLHDTGHDFGERILAPALRRLGVERIDYLVATHAHPDHIGGLSYVVRNFAVQRLLLPDANGGGEGQRKLADEFRRHGAEIRLLKVGDRMTLPGNVAMEVLSPSAGNHHAESDSDIDENEESLVFKLDYRKFGMLFTADAGFSSEARMLAERRNLKATFLKVGHHGSRYSTSDEFLDKVQPRGALVSAGYANRFGLPAQETLEQFGRRRIPLWRTDRDGTVLVTTDGFSWEVSTPFQPEPERPQRPFDMTGFLR